MFSRTVPQPKKFDNDLLFCVIREIPKEDRLVEHIADYEYTRCMSQEAASEVAAKTGGNVAKWKGFAPHPTWE